MKYWIIAALAFAIALGLFWATRTDLIFGDTESKGAAADIGEWVKLAISLVSLAIGVVNLRLAIAKSKAS